MPRSIDGRTLLDVAPLLRPDGVAPDGVPVTDELGQPFKPRGRLLEGAPSIAEEELPRQGVVLRRAWQMTRSADGRIHVWIGRRRETGSGEASSGLRFDVVEHGSM